MNIENVIQKYIDYCELNGISNVQSIEPIEYELIGTGNGVYGGILRIRVVSNHKRTIIIEHKDDRSFAFNIDIVKRM